MLDVFTTDVFKSVLFVVSALCESFCFTVVVFSSAILGTGSYLVVVILIGVYITSLCFESWLIDEFMILPLFLICSLRNNICSSRWFINLSDISLVEFPWTCSLGLCLTHDCKNSFLKLLTSVKNDFSIFLNSSKICNLRFPISSIKTGFSWFSSFCLNFWFSFGSDKHCQFPVIFNLTDLF